jgi:hypothetical protein
LYALSLLGQAVRNEANVLSYNHGFAIVSLVAVVMLVLTALLGPAPQSPDEPSPNGAGATA